MGPGVWEETKGFICWMAKEFQLQLSRVLVQQEENDPPTTCIIKFAEDTYTRTAVAYACFSIYHRLALSPVGL
jgi:hypothetical protein